ncbi:MAG: helix-turn-helix transcriptional regulator [Acidimicrobiales bacterium]
MSLFLNRTDRLFALVDALRTAGPRGRTSEWLAEHFEVSPRTIKRDITALQDSGLPVWGAGGPGGGYVIESAASLPPLSFTPGEATAISIALSTQTGLPFADDGRSALTKVLAAMSPERVAAARELAGRVWLTHSIQGADGEVTAVRRTLGESLRTQTVAIIDYVDASGTSTERRPIEPMCFAHSTSHWYVLAWCRTRDAGRWFRLDRVTAAWTTTERFDLRNLVDVFGEPPPDVRAIQLT